MDYFDIDFEELLEYIDEHIRQNQSDELTLEEIAKQYYISKYYFHRLFHSAIGEPFAKFIKQRRLLFASYEILSTDKDLIDIAYDYGFNSQDVFIRGFKQLFGYTPGYFRKLYREIIFTKRDTLKFKGVNIMFDIFLGQRLQFSDNDKRECLETVEQILKFLELTRSRGLLSLDSYISSLDNFFLKKGLLFATDSYDSDLIREILQNYIISGNYKGKDLLQRILILEGVISIINGENRRVVYEKLASYFGESFYSEYEEYFKFNSENPNAHKEIIDSFREKIKGKEYPPNTNLLEEHFKSLSDIGIQILIRNISSNDCIIAICGSSEFVINKLINNMPLRAASSIITSYKYKEEDANGERYSAETIIRAQNRILAKLFELKSSGEIKM